MVYHFLVLDSYIAHFFLFRTVSLPGPKTLKDSTDLFRYGRSVYNDEKQVVFEDGIYRDIKTEFIKNSVFTLAFVPPMFFSVINTLFINGEETIENAPWILKKRGGLCM